MAETIDRKELARLCYDIFEVDKRGQRIFAYLASARWVRTPRREGGIDAVLDMARCSAYREVIDDLAVLINMGRQPESEPEQASTQTDDTDPDYTLA